MKTMKVWACLTRAGVVARDGEGRLITADSKQMVELMVYEYDKLEFGSIEETLRRKRWRIARIELAIKEVE